MRQIPKFSPNVRQIRMEFNSSYTRAANPLENIRTTTFYCAHLFCIFLNLGYKAHDSGTSFWTSGSDARVEGEWIWTATGQPVSFTNWRPSEPNDLKYGPNGEDYLIMSFAFPGKWNDVPDDRKPYGYRTYTICESNQ